jgi:hypothetical protein
MWNEFSIHSFRDFIIDVTVHYIGYTKYALSVVSLSKQEPHEYSGHSQSVVTHNPLFLTGQNVGCHLSFLPLFLDGGGCVIITLMVFTVTL